MTTRVFETRIAAPVEALWAYHASVEALTALTPPDKRVTLLPGDTDVRNGALHRLRIRSRGLPIRWDARISEVTPPTGFTDSAERSPFAFWRHRHEFVPDGDGSILRDTVTYALPFGVFGRLVQRLFVDRDIERMFAHRHAVTRRALEGASGKVSATP